MKNHYHPEDTQPIYEGGTRGCLRLIDTPSSPARRRDDDPIVIHDIAQVDAELSIRLDAAGHTVCELDKHDYRALLSLAQGDRAALLAERRGYVVARRGDQSRFVELIKMLDTKIEAATRLTDKLARLWAQS